MVIVTIYEKEMYATGRALRIERHFNDTNGLSFEIILKSMIKERVENIINSSYHDEQSKLTSSEEGGLE